MPRDCTASPQWLGINVQSPCHWVSHTMTNKTRNKKTKQKQRRKPTPFADAGAITGQALGSMFSMPYLKGVGKWLGSGIGQIFGSGDYRMMGPAPSYNVLMSDRQIPKFSTGDRTNIVCHREYIGEINGQAPFTNRLYPLNPGVSTTFPWLSTIAKNYSQYRIHGMIFEFRPLVTDFVTGGAPGVVVIATNYNADQPAYKSKVEMENSEYAVSVKPTMNLMHGIECAEKETPLTKLYVRGGAVPAGQDLRSYDLGLTQVVTLGNPSQLLGELWVSYCVEFFKPKMNDDLGGDFLSTNVSRSVFTNAQPLGTIQTQVQGDVIGLSVNALAVNFDGTNIPGIYMVHIIWSGDVASAFVQPIVTLFGGATFSPIMFNNSTSNISTVNGSVNQRVFYTAYVNIPESDFASGLTLGTVGTLPTVNTNVNIYVTKVEDPF